MNIQQKTELVKAWGFIKVEGGKELYERNTFYAQGFTEYWEANSSDYIQFYKDGQRNHNYKIDWDLFKSN